MNETRKDINKYLKENNWNGYLIEWFAGEINRWNKHETNEQAFDSFKRSREAIEKSIIREYNAKNQIGVCYCGKCNKCLFG